MTWPSHRVLGVWVHHVRPSEVVAHVAASAASGGGGAVYSVNLDTLRQAHQDSAIRGLFDEAELRIADGMPLLWASRVAGDALPCRVAGSTLVPELAGAARDNNLKVFLLGGAPGTATLASEALKAQSPGLEIVGTVCPPFGFDEDATELAAVAAAVATASPDIVFVGLGFPKQERVIRHLRVAYPGAWYVSCGITFSFLAGVLPRAPQWMQRAGLEWLHRFRYEPRRLFRRYFLLDLPFLPVLIGSAVKSRFSRQPDEQPMGTGSPG